MAFDFATPVERRHPEVRGVDAWPSQKWHHYGEEALPLWVADMDFASPPAVIEALQARVARTRLGTGLGGGRRQRDRRQVDGVEPRGRGAADDQVTVAHTVVIWLLQTTVWVVFVLAMLSNLGINVTTFVASLGIGGECFTWYISLRSCLLFNHLAYICTGFLSDCKGGL